ncbi:MAG: RNA methyltransferase [Proteobacteria bacterium]|nr:RNA methyltransferase [Pseudomonadota bacterium]
MLTSGCSATGGSRPGGGARPQAARRISDEPGSPRVPIRFVLVETRHPGNIGAAARALKTMGQSELWLVAPAAFPHAEATALASGADDLLARARVVPTLAEAVADCGLVLGTSARLRTQYYWPVESPRAAAPRLLAAERAGGAAVVFGTERTGLSNADFDLCHGLLHIPANPEYESLNLAQAVQIVAYEILCAGDAAPRAARRLAPLAPVEELERLRAHLGEVLEEIDFTDRRGGPHLLRRLARIFGRAGLDQQEVNILRGVLTAVQARRRRAGSGP